MGAGDAQGPNLAYQVLVKKIISILSQQESLIPLDSDGIDVPVEMGGTKWKLDILLKTIDENRIIVGECKRWRQVIKQNDIAAFAYKVVLLREKTNKEVRAIFFTKKRFQPGAERAAAYAGIELALCEEGLPLEGTFGLQFRRYDPQANIHRQDALVRLATLHCKVELQPVKAK